ncbi:hypothetical protein CCACVL1_04640, partial [Corchorus capsularis]
MGSTCKEEQRKEIGGGREEQETDEWKM